MIGGIVSLQFGSSVAVLLFPRAGALGVVTLRLVVASLVLLIACRPKLRGYGRGDWATVVGFGIALAGMNSSSTRRSTASRWVRRSPWSSWAR